MKIYRLNFIFFITLPLMGCGNRLYEQPKDQYQFEIKMKELLGGDLDVVNSINKVEVQNSSVDLPKNLIIQNEYKFTGKRWVDPHRGRSRYRYIYI